MNRQIKFRTWDKNRQSFIGPINLLGDQKYVVLPENWPWENYHEVVNLSVFATTLKEASEQRNEYARKNWIVQQWTGLLDKNGREIYEGDIVKLIDAEGWPDNAKGSVGFYNGTYIIPDLDVSLGDFKVEVIGNIFENPLDNPLTKD